MSYSQHQDLDFQIIQSLPLSTTSKAESITDAISSNVRNEVKPLIQLPDDIRRDTQNRDRRRILSRNAKLHFAETKGSKNSVQIGSRKLSVYNFKVLRNINPTKQYR